MTKKNKIVVVAFFIILLLMGIGYAAISNVMLTINGQATATAEQDNFKPHFTKVQDTEVVKGPPGNLVEVDASINTTDKTKATLNITGLSTKNDSAYAILEIVNESANIDAESINVIAQGTNTDLFKIEAIMCDENGNAISDYSVASGDYTYVKVSATLKETALENDSTVINVQIEAVPEE